MRPDGDFFAVTYFFKEKSCKGFLQLFCHYNSVIVGVSIKILSLSRRLKTAFFIKSQGGEVF